MSKHHVEDQQSYSPPEPNPVNLTFLRGYVEALSQTATASSDYAAHFRTHHTSVSYIQKNTSMDEQAADAEPTGEITPPEPIAVPSAAFLRQLERASHPPRGRRRSILQSATRRRKRSRSRSARFALESVPIRPCIVSLALFVSAGPGVFLPVHSRHSAEPLDVVE